MGEAWRSGEIGERRAIVIGTRPVGLLAVVAWIVMAGSLVVLDGVAHQRTASAEPLGQVTVRARGIDGPTGITPGPDGNVWFVQSRGNAIGRITPAGVVAHYSDPTISDPRDIVLGPDGNLWFTNYGNNSIGRITPAGVVANFTHASISGPQSITAGKDGNMWFTNFALSVGRITPAGVVSSFTVSTNDEVSLGPITAGPDGNIWFSRSSQIGRMTPAGVLTWFTAPAGAWSLTPGPDGAVWFGRAEGVGRISPSGVVSTVVETGVNPGPMTTAPNGDVWFASSNPGANRVARVTPTGALSWFPVPTIPATFMLMPDLAVGADGNVWVTDNQDRIGRVTPASGAVSYFVGAAIRGPQGIAKGADGAMWFTNNSNDSIGRITTAGEVSTFALPGVFQPGAITWGADGNAWFVANGNAFGRLTPAGALALFPTTFRLLDLAPGPDGNVWATGRGEFSAEAILKITPTGSITSYTSLELDHAQSITSGPDGNLWFTNKSGNSIGRVTTAGVISVFKHPGIESPQGLAVGSDGNLWFGSGSGGGIGRITTAGAVSVVTERIIGGADDLVAGPDGNIWFTASGDLGAVGRVTPAGVVSRFPSADVSSVAGIAAGPDGNMWITNAWSYQILTVGTGLSVPGAPTKVTANAGDHEVTVAWTAPASAGSSPITSYTVTASPGGATCTWSAGPLHCTVPGLANGVAHTFTVTATNAVGAGPVSAPSAAVIPTAPGLHFHPLAPVRILDSRGPLGGWAAPLQAGTPRTLDVAVSGVPSGAAAVVMNVTVTNGTQNSFLTLYPGGTTTPNASNLNFAAGQTIPNLVTVMTGSGANAGRVAFANANGAVDVVADVVGYYSSAPGDRFEPLDPARILDSRGATGGWSSRLQSGAPRALTVAGAGGVPASADAVVMNVTVTGGSHNSFLTAYPTGGATPNASNLNFAAGQTIPNLVTVKLGTGAHAGKVSFANASGAVDVIADVVGYFDAGHGDLFHPLAPTRVLDSRGPVGGWNGKVASGAPKQLTVTGGGLPVDTSAVVANTTVTDGTQNSFLTLYPTGGGTPNASNLNFAAGQTIPNLVTVKVGTGAQAGKVTFANANGATHVIFDLVGYFAPT